MNVLRTLALTGGEWVIYLLLASSILSVAVMIERFLLLRREKKEFESFRERLERALLDGRLEEARKILEGSSIGGACARILSEGLSHAIPAQTEEILLAVSLRERRRLEERLLILGTLGNNAPFIGLFGTVLGVIKAFHDLAQEGSAGPEVVMSGLSEALIATAVGLLVAIPCVIAYNYLQKRVRDLLTDAESIGRLILAQLKKK